jgi:hypothetical protein
VLESVFFLAEREETQGSDCGQKIERWGEKHIYSYENEMEVIVK